MHLAFNDLIQIAAELARCPWADDFRTRTRERNEDRSKVLAIRVRAAADSLALEVRILKATIAEMEKQRK